MAIRWVLSEKCEQCPKCRPRGTNDLYGLGPGVYPDDKFPKHPEHWGCNCTTENIPDEDRLKTVDMPAPTSLQ